MKDYCLEGFLDFKQDRGKKFNNFIIILNMVEIVKLFRINEVTCQILMLK